MAKYHRIQKERIRRWLKEKDLKQAFLMKQLKVSRSTLSRMLNQGHVPEDPILVVRLALLMGCEVDDLLGDAKPEKVAA